MPRQAQQVLLFNTQGQGLYEITRDVISWTESCPITTGLLTIYCRHTSASLIIQENADPAVLEDLQHFFKQLGASSVVALEESSRSVVARSRKLQK